MTRCDCEGVFYRVFCISLLIIAFTFTVILTNVFVDIDSLLSKRERELTENVRDKEPEPVTDNHDTTSTTEVQDYYIGVETNGEINYRNKRSIDSENFFLRINNPKTKSYLTNKLATLLEALDDDDQDITSPKPDNGNIYIKTVKQKNNIEINEMLPESDKPAQMPDENIVYSALHSMLQGIGHVDVYRLVDKLQTLVKNFKRDESQKESKTAKSMEELYPEATTKETIDLNEDREDVTETSLKYVFTDKKFRSNNVFTPSYIETTHVGDKKGVRNKNPTYLIKTFIDIEKDGKAISTEDVYGVIKMTLNGKPIKTKRDDSFEATTETTIIYIQNTTSNVTNSTINNDVEQFAGVLREKFKNRLASDTYLKTIALEYLKKIAKSNDSLATTAKNKIRVKRNVDSSNEKQMETVHTKDDDELFVEIETHFDRSGTAGEKKRKLVTNLIEKIQKAIRSNPDNNPSQDNNQSKPLMKRIQSPLDSETVQSVQIQSKPVSSAYRTLDPISKSMPITDPLPLVANKDGEQWKKQYPHPKFLSLSKSINSAELNQIAVDFKPQEKYPPVPKRVQIPLTVDTSQETINTEDIGKLQLLIKDIEGTGFSIGYNQYVDQAPDPDSMKLFHGIEDIVKKYHQKNDSPDPLAKHEGDYEMYGQEMKKREVKSVEAPLRTKRFVINRQNIRQSVKKGNDYHQNEFIYNDHYHSYDTYKEVHDVSKRSTGFLSNYIQRLFLRGNGKSLQNPHRKKRAITLKTLVNSNRKLQVNKFLNTNTFTGRKTYFKLSKRRKRQIEDIEATDKTAITSENNNIFVVTNGDDYNDNLFVRRRPEPDLFFIEVINSKNVNPLPKNKPFFQPSNHLFGSHTFKIQNKNKFYTNPMFYKRNANLIKIQENKERTKRQLHTLRIIDRDIGIRNSNQESLPEYGGDLFAKKEIVPQLDGPQIIADEDEKGEVKYSSSKMNKAPLVSSNQFVTDSTEYDSFKPKSPVILSNKKTYSRHEFGISPTWDQMIEHPLMAKYPHIFGEVGIRELPQVKHYQRRMLPKEESKESDTLDNEESYQSSNVQDLVQAVVPSQKKHYKVSIRLIPHENDHNTNPSFKEIHTSINKTFNKNGYLFSSLVNVSEISNVEIPKVNTTHICNHHLNSTTPNILETNSNIPVSRRGTHRRINKHVQTSTEKPIENTTTTKGKMEMNLMDIIVPPSPQKVFHLTVADLGKLICDAMKSKNSEKSSTSYSETTEITTTSSTTMMTTVIPKRRSTQTVDPLKTKLLKAISQNEQLTSQILNRIDQNTDILQTFLSKITSEIAKLPDMTSKAIQERDSQARQEKNSLYEKEDAKFYTTTMTNPIPVTYAHHKPSQNLKQAATRHQTLIQSSPILKNRVMIDRRVDLPTIQTNIVEPRQNDQAKYFLDKNLVPHDTADKHIVSDGVDEKTSKLGADVITHNKLDHKL